LAKVEKHIVKVVISSARIMCIIIYWLQRFCCTGLLADLSFWSRYSASLR